MNLLFLDPIPWDYDVASPTARPLGGSQSAACYLTIELARRGHRVTLVSGTTRERVVQAVSCRSLTTIDSTFLSQPLDALVVVNSPADQCLHLRPHLAAGTPLVYWAHNTCDLANMRALTRFEVRAGWDAVVCVSQWHRQTLISEFGFDPSRVFALRNAVAPAFEGLFTDRKSLIDAKGKDPALAYTSAPFRGLDVLLDVYPEVHERHPGATLRVYSSMKIYQHDESADTFAPLYRRCRSMPGVDYVGSLPQSRLAEALRSASTLSFPSTFVETSSIAVMEAMAAGLLIVTSDLGALPETTSGMACLVPALRPGEARSEFAGRFRTALADVLQRHAEDPSGFAADRFDQVQEINQHNTWSRRAQEWEAAVNSWNELNSEGNDDRLEPSPRKREPDDRGGAPSFNNPFLTHRPPIGGPSKGGGGVVPLKLAASPPGWYATRAPAAASGTSASPATPAGDEPWLEVTSSREFPGWLAEQKVSLGFTTYQSGKLFLLGSHPDGRLSVFERTFNRCMGLWADGQTLWMNSLYQLWRLENVLEPGQSHEGHDRLYVPRVGYTTADLDVHDIGVRPDGQVIFVNTKFGCLATLDHRHSFKPLWKPPFLSRLAPEDRCHLNGLAMENGQPRHVTIVAPSDVTDGWRERRRDGGCIVEVPSGKTVVSGLSMPHSPRWHKGTLYVHNSGTGYFGRVDLEHGKFVPLTFCPGYLRGLAFAGDHAIVGLSRPRHDKTFSGLELDDNLRSSGAQARCGLQVINLRNGDVLHWVRLEGMVSELYDVVALPGVARPMALGFKNEDIQRIITIGEQGSL